MTIENTRPSPRDFGLVKAAYSTKETEYLLSVSHTTLYELINRNKLRSTKLGSKTLFLAVDIADFLASLQQEGQ